MPSPCPFISRFRARYTSLWFIIISGGLFLNINRALGDVSLSSKKTNLWFFLNKLLTQKRVYRNMSYLACVLHAVAERRRTDRENTEKGY